MGFSAIVWTSNELVLDREKLGRLSVVDQTTTSVYSV
jgi:hypothetical protein